MGRTAASSRIIVAAAVLCGGGALAGCGSSGAAQDARDAAAARDAPASNDVPQGAADGAAKDVGAPADHAGGDASATCPLTKVFAAPCNSLAPSGPVVVSACSSDAAPTAQGGTVTDGLYALESATWYGGCQQASMARSVWLVCGELWDNAAATPGGDAGVSHTNYLSAIQGTTNTLNPICSTSGPVAGMAYGYSATADRLTLMTNYGNAVLVTTYARQ